MVYSDHADAASGAAPIERPMADQPMPTHQASRQFLTDLFNHRTSRHGIAFNPALPRCEAGDFTLTDRPLSDYLPHFTRMYERRIEWHEKIGDDAVPYVSLNTNTGVFAAAFGCPVHEYAADTNAAAMPIVWTAAEADALEQPDLAAPTIERIMAMADLLQRELGPDVCIGVPDIQSPLDIAALVWQKEAFLIAMFDQPDAVHRLIDKCYHLLVKFLEAFSRQVGDVNLSHCPYAWAPPEMGCWLSEDEVGAISLEAFREFAQPTLRRLSDHFGGIFIHCCAAADHQYPGFAELPNLRAINRVFQYPPGPQPAIERFSGGSVFMQAWLDEQQVRRFIEMAQPRTRYLFNPSANDLDHARRMFDRLRPLCEIDNAPTQHRLRSIRW